MDQDKGKQKSYGIHARFGEDDMDVVKDLNLNRALAYTPEILTAALDKVEKRNIQARVIHWKGTGKTFEEAVELAKKEAASMRTQAEKNIAKEQKVRKY